MKNVKKAIWTNADNEAWNLITQICDRPFRVKIFTLQGHVWSQVNKARWPVIRDVRRYEER